MAGDHSLKNVKTKNKFPCPHYLPVHPPQITTNTIKLVPSHQENSGTTLSWVSKQPYKPIPSPVNRSCLWHLGHQVVLDCTKDPHGLGQVPWPPVQAGSPWPFIYIYICKLLSRVQLCDPMDCSPPGSSVHRISQARILDWVAISFSRGSSRPRDRTQVSHISGGFFISWATRGVCLPAWHDLF